MIDGYRCRCLPDFSGPNCEETLKSVQSPFGNATEVDDNISDIRDEVAGRDMLFLRSSLKQGSAKVHAKVHTLHYVS